MSDDSRTPTEALAELARAHADEIHIIRERAARAETEADRLRAAVIEARDLLTAAVAPTT